LVRNFRSYLPQDVTISLNASLNNQSKYCNHLPFLLRHISTKATMMKKRCVGIRRKKKTSKVVEALQKDQEIRKAGRDVDEADASVCSNSYSAASSKGSCYSMRSTSLSLSSATYSVGGRRHPTTYAAFSNRQIGIRARHFDVLLPPKSPIASGLAATNDPSEEFFLEGLLVMAPDSKEMLDDLLHPDPFGL
jgi:hypothetical protein